MDLPRPVPDDIVTDALRLTAGLRITDEEKHYVGGTLVLLVFGPMMIQLSSM